MKHLLLALLAFFSLSLTVCGQSREVFGFTNFVNEKIYKQYDLKKLSVLVFLDNNIDEQFIRYAQTNKVRTYLSATYPKEKLGDEKFRHKWFKNISANLIRYKIDGLNFDFNEPISKDDVKRQQLTDLIRYLKSNLASQNAEFSVTVPWSPINKGGTAANGQDYDYLEIVKEVDYLLVKGYHVNSQVFVGSEYDDDVCLAKSNAGFFDLAAGLMKWLTLNDTQTNSKFYSDELMDYPMKDLTNSFYDELNLKSKIILVYGWFGNHYVCAQRVERQRCLLEPVPFIDANCSDKGSTERTYSYIWSLIVKNKIEVFQDPHSRSTYLEFVDKNKKTNQLWFDNYYDYTLKYTYVKSFGIKGMGIMALDYQNYEDKELLKTTNYMWQLIPKLK